MTAHDEVVRGLKEAALQRVSDDFLGLWEIPSLIQVLYADTPPTERKALTIQIVDDLLKAGLIRAGELDDTGRRFVPSDLSREQVIKLIRDSWTNLGRDPNIGEVIWFDTVD